MRLEESASPAVGEARGCEEQLRAFERASSGCNSELAVGVSKAELLREAAALKGHAERLLFGAACPECTRMAAIPQGAFAVLQVRKNFERTYASRYSEEQQQQQQQREEEESPRDNRSFNAKVLQDEGRELTPLKYNSKLMNSIWGLYNRYSVHNFKKIDANEPANFLAGAWDALSSPAENVVAEVPAARIIGASRVAGH